ncbi:MAG TPA: 16S rRNA (cytosine(1402)-N(4))-methyltransferase, partial [Flavisolibacter sp.]
QLHRIFEQYGEVTNSKTLARTIVEARRSQPIQTVDGFRNAVRAVVKGNPNKYFAQVFQAIRIEVNEETEALREMLEQAAQVLKKGGRIAVITFHSGEDRIVKQFFRSNTFEEEEEHPFESRQRVKILQPVNKKPLTATEEEMKKNPRSRSARLRVAEKI